MRTLFPARDSFARRRPVRRLVAGGGFVVLLLCAVPLAAEAQAEGPSSYVEAVEDRGSTGGVEAEVDAGAAQASAAQAGDEVGLSRRAMSQVEEIVVSARRREEMLEDTPVSVTALGESTLREANVTRLDDIQQLVPNLTINQAQGGQDALLRIRGVGTPRGLIQFDPGVGMYIDGIYLARAQGPLIDTVDIQQIEVLRGPQGTLFGKNTVGGAVNITTVKPSPELEGFALVRPGNFGSINTRAMLNVPVVEDLLYVRAAVGSQNNEGYTLNSFRNERRSDLNSFTFLGSIRLLPVDDLTVDVSGSWSKNDTHALGARCRVVQTTGLQGLVPDYPEACERSTPLVFESNVHTLSSVESYGIWGTISYDLGDPVPGFSNLVVKNLTSWRQQVVRQRFDIDMTADQVVRLAAIGGPSIADGRPAKNQQISTELQLAGQAWDDRISFVTGLFGYWENGQDNRASVSLENTLNRIAITDSSTDNWNIAAYGQATANFTDWLAITGGIRWTEEKKGLEALMFLVTDPNNPDVNGNETAKFRRWTPMGSLQLTMPQEWMPDQLDHLMGYFTYAQGFRGGGFNAVGSETGALDPFAPETLDSYEIGFKTIAFDQRLTFNFDVFLAKYDDIQVTAVREVGDTDGDGVPNVIQITQNAAAATLKGMEIESLFIPIQGLQLTGSVGLIDTEYDEYIGISVLTSDPIDRSGESFAGTPEWQTFLSAQYSFQVPTVGPQWLNGWLTPRLEWAYQSAVFFGGPEVTIDRQHGYNLLNGRLSFDFNDDRTQVALWGRNLTDEIFFIQAGGLVSTFGTTQQFTGPPRMWGAEISHRF